MPRGVKNPEPAAVQEAEAVVEAAFENAPSTEEAPKRSFDPTRHLMKLKGKDYLEVKWRLVWFRDVHPDGVLITELVQANEKSAIFKATVSAHGAGVATGYGSEEKTDFGDFLEKAETKAVGRALGALGFGTQFSDDFEFGAEQGKVVDSPVGRGSNGRSSGGTSRTPVPTGPDPSTFPKSNSPEGEGYICEECADNIPDTTRQDGSPYPAGEKAAQSVKHFGKILCATHMRAAKETKLAAQG